MTLLCLYNDTFVEKHQLAVSIDDLGFSRGYSLFEHCRTYFGTPFHLQEHLIRLLRGADHLLLNMPYSFEEIEQKIDLLLSKNDFEECGLKLYLTGGVSSDGLTPAPHPTFIIYPYQLQPYQSLYAKQGLHLKTTSLARAFPNCKTTFYLPGLLAKRLSSPCDDILFLDATQHILEATTAGFLAFIGDRLIVPQGDLLTSVTQELLISLAQPLFKVERRSLAYAELPSLSEAFLCSTTKEILPIATIDGYTIGSGVEHKNSLRLKEALTDYVLSKKWPLLEIFSQDLSVNSLR